MCLGLQDDDIKGILEKQDISLTEQEIQENQNNRKIEHYALRDTVTIDLADTNSNQAAKFLRALCAYGYLHVNKIEQDSKQYTISKVNSLNEEDNPLKCNGIV